mgnify:CR=1 FL=1
MANVRKHPTPEGWKVCKARPGNCPIAPNSVHFDNDHDRNLFMDEIYGDNKIDCPDDLKLEHHIQKKVYDEKKSSGDSFNMQEANRRGDYVDKITKYHLEKGNDTKSKYYNNEMNRWNKERRKVHKEIINELLEEFKDVPSEGKVIMSGGLPGAGKTTTLTQYAEIDMDRYAFVSSDDIKEKLAEKGLVPEIDGLTQMEASTLVHEESSDIANEFLSELAKEKKNIIYDFTCKSSKSAKNKINFLVDNFEYSKKDVELIFVDIKMDTSRERAKARYQHGLNESLNDGISGRYLPDAVISECAPEKGVHNSKNAEAVIELSQGYLENTPRVFYNGDSYPEEINFTDFLLKNY